MPGESYESPVRQGGWHIKKRTGGSREQSKRTKPVPNYEGSRLRKRQDILRGRKGPDSRGEYEYASESESVPHHRSDWSAARSS